VHTHYCASQQQWVSDTNIQKVFAVPIPGFKSNTSNTNTTLQYWQPWWATIKAGIKTGEWLVLPSCLCAERLQGAPKVRARWRSPWCRWRMWLCGRRSPPTTSELLDCAAALGDVSELCWSRIAARRLDTRKPCLTPADRNIVRASLSLSSSIN